MNFSLRLLLRLKKAHGSELSMRVLTVFGPTWRGDGVARRPVLTTIAVKQ